MKRLSYVFGATLLSGAALAQTFTTSGVTGSGVTATGISVAGVLEGVTVAGSATYNLVGLGTGFNRYDVRAISTRNVGSFSTLETAAPTASTTVPGIATRTLTSTGTANSASNTDWYIGQSGSTFAISASAMRDDTSQPSSASASVGISATQARGDNSAGVKESHKKIRLIEVRTLTERREPDRTTVGRFPDEMILRTSGRSSLVRWSGCCSVVIAVHPCRRNSGLCPEHFLCAATIEANFRRCPANTRPQFTL